jgi:hypothetical protein
MVTKYAEVTIKSPVKKVKNKLQNAGLIATGIIFITAATGLVTTNVYQAAVLAIVGIGLIAAERAFFNG